MTTMLWIDDIREAPTKYWAIARTSDSAIEHLEFWQNLNVEVNTVSFDHDLGEDDTSRRVLDWMIIHDFWPQFINIHSFNPVGRRYLVKTAQRYAPAGTYITESGMA